MSKQLIPFAGFEPANTTPVPDIFFDELMSELSNAELRVLLYIIRRTWGFKKDTDAISFNQFLKGITTKDGRVLDKGCGVTSRGALSKALKDLEDRGCIVTVKGKDPLGDNLTTLYTIRFKSRIAAIETHKEGGAKNELPLVPKSNHPSSKNEPRVVLKSNQQETVLQKTVKQYTDNKREDSDNKPQSDKLTSSPLSQENSLNEEKETKKPDQVELFRATFIALGKEYFQYDKFTASKVQPNSDVYARILDIIGDGDVSPQSLRIAFLKLYNCKDRDGSYWWREMSKLTLKAFVNNYNDQDDTQRETDPYVLATMQSAGRLLASTPGSQYVDQEQMRDIDEGLIFGQLPEYWTEEHIKHERPIRQDSIRAKVNQWRQEHELITAGPLAGQPDYHADPWA